MGETLEKFISNMKASLKISDFIEIRFDDIGVITPDNQVRILEKILHEIPRSKEFIFTCRPKAEGGNYCLEESDRAVLLDSFIGLFHANKFVKGYIDIEVSTLKKWTYKLYALKLIASYHNFENTQTINTLNEIITEMRAFNPSVMKIATKVNQMSELNNLYRLILDNQDVQTIAIGMGEMGKMSRVIAPLMGAPWTYASSPHGSSAPGQIDISELMNIYSRMTVLEAATRGICHPERSRGIPF